jgi:hypothetical protein
MLVLVLVLVLVFVIAIDCLALRLGEYHAKAV